MKELERQYRASIRWYSGRWQRAHGEALLGTLLEGAEAENRSRPTTQEKRNLALMGLRQRAFSVIPYVLFAVAFVAFFFLAAAWQAGFHSNLVLTVPSLGYPVFSALGTGIAGAGVFVISGGLAAMLLRRNRRALNTGASTSRS